MDNNNYVRSKWKYSYIRNFFYLMFICFNCVGVGEKCRTREVKKFVAVETIILSLKKTHEPNLALRANKQHFPPIAHNLLFCSSGKTFTLVYQYTC